MSTTGYRAWQQVTLGAWRSSAAMWIPLWIVSSKTEGFTGPRASRSGTMRNLGTPIRPGTIAIPAAVGGWRKKGSITSHRLLATMFSILAGDLHAPSIYSNTSNKVHCWTPPPPPPPPPAEIAYRSVFLFFLLHKNLTAVAESFTSFSFSLRIWLH